MKKKSTKFPGGYNFWNNECAPCFRERFDLDPIRQAIKSKLKDLYGIEILAETNNE